MCMDYYNLAIKRESTRSFKRRPVSDKQLAELSGYFPQCARLLPEIETDIRILGAEVCSLLKGCAGYHDLMIEGTELSGDCLQAGGALSGKCRLHGRGSGLENDGAGD